MKNQIKYIIIFAGVFLVRLIPFRVPNIEPIMAAIMPFGKVYGGFMSFIFGAASIIIYDLALSKIGIWTLMTAIAYGIIGYGSYFYFKNRSGWKSYASYAVVATIFYDVLTGLTIGPLFFHQSFMVSLVGQIPFTVLHLIGNVSFAIILSPAIEMWITSSEINKSFLFKKAPLINVNN